MKWLNLAGLTLQFLAFWFAAPELLGESTMKRLENGLIRLVSSLPVILIAGGAIVFGVFMAIAGVRFGLEAGREGAENLNLMFVILGVSVISTLYFALFSAKTTRWMKRKYATPLINKLIASEQFRKTALQLGAVLFSVGFVLQFVVMLLS
ncbi:MAG: hypothetical protein GC181_09355 [Bacteroidetes bacterium]|nr:hypothetical protein [Bacteroidota bacterium]